VNVKLNDALLNTQPKSPPTFKESVKLLRMFVKTHRDTVKGTRV
jgi:hypothetical protein